MNSKSVQSLKTLLDGKFILKSSKTVVCKYCKKEFKYHRSLSSLNYHLRTKHAFSVMDGPSTSSATPVKSETTGRQTTLSDFNRRGEAMDQARYDYITNAIVKWVATNSRPINIVTDEGLQDVIRAASANQSYKLPSRSVINSRIDDLYEAQRAIIMEIMSEAEFVALTGDFWLSIANDSYLGVTGHLIDINWNLQSFALCVNNIEERHYAENCAEHFAAVAKSWKIFNKVTTFGTDNARNMTAALRMLPFADMPCAAHSLQLSVNKAVADSGVDAILAKCRKVVGHFRHSPVNTAELKTYQLQLYQRHDMLIQDVPTRWNSTLQMIERLLSNKEAVLLTLRHEDHKHSLSIPTEVEWEKLRYLQKVLTPCRSATEFLGGDKYISCSIILPTLCHLQFEMLESDDDPTFIIRFKESLKADLEQRKQNFNLLWLTFATCLDPRFKNLKCLRKEQRDEVWAKLQTAVANSVEPDEVVSQSPDRKKKRLHEFSSDSEDEPLAQKPKDMFKSEVNRYRLEQQVDMDMSPLLWWSEHEQRYPSLSIQARKYLASPATTVPCERLFSLFIHYQSS